MYMHVVNRVYEILTQMSSHIMCRSEMYRISYSHWGKYHQNKLTR